MVTYFYWFVVMALMAGIIYVVGVKFDKWKVAAIGSFVVFIVGIGTYYFHFQQIFVKRYGGVMSINVPEGQQHITATWKDDNLWIENYDPKTNICYFTEYSRGNLLQGKVTIKNCNPLLRQVTVPSPDSPKEQ